MVQVAKEFVPKTFNSLSTINDNGFDKMTSHDFLKNSQRKYKFKSGLMSDQ